MTPIQQLTAKIASIQTALSALQVDEPAAFARFKQILIEANETKAVLLVAGVVTGPIGNIDLPVTLIPGTFKPSGVQADFVVPPSLTFISATLGPIPAGEGKSIQTNMIGSVLRVLVFGLNQTVITEGLDFTLAFKTTVKGQYPMVLQNPVASDANGNALALCVTSGQIGVS
jgi:hypothetical protein